MAAKMSHFPDQPNKFSKKLDRQYWANTITDSLEVCNSRIEKILKEIGKPHRDQKLLNLLRALSGILWLLVDANRRADDRAVDYENRLEEVERQLQEWKKYYPLPDGK